jgi:hypothetical protein
MRHLTRLIGPGKSRKVLVAVCALAALAAPALLSAAPAGAATPASFTLVAGALAISSPTTGISLGSQTASASDTTMSGQLGAVTVTDQRGGVTTWTASVISTAFTPTPGPADPASNVSYAAGAFTDSATVTATAVNVSNLTGAVTIATGASTGISSATWDPTISVIVPADFAPGLYTATITSSVA